MTGRSWSMSSTTTSSSYARFLFCPLSLHCLHRGGLAPDAEPVLLVAPRGIGRDRPGGGGAHRLPDRRRAVAASVDCRPPRPPLPRWRRTHRLAPPLTRFMITKGSRSGTECDRRRNLRHWYDRDTVIPVFWSSGAGRPCSSSAQPTMVCVHMSGRITIDPGGCVHSASPLAR